MLELLDRFWETWDSGGAVSAAAPLLQRLLVGRPLKPLTGAPDEWVAVGNGVHQNKRLSSVFLDPRFHNGQKAYDLDNPAGPRVAIEFPYYPESLKFRDPVVEVGQSEAQVYDRSLSANEIAALAAETKPK